MAEPRAERTGLNPIDAVTGACSASSGWSVEEDPNGVWVRAFRRDRHGPTEGWKLHVSATPDSAAAVLAAALPVLAEANVSFKVCTGVTALRQLNRGAWGKTQVGKFLTVYPSGPNEAVTVARALRDATVGARGPAVPTDRPVAPGSVVHYRYGSFGGRWLQDADGEVTAALDGPQGVPVADRRVAGRVAPPWVDDPFVDAGLGLADQSPLVDGRWLACATLHRSTRSRVLLAVDLERQCRCVLKRSLRDSHVTPEGIDGIQRLRREAGVLERLQSLGCVPDVVDVVEHADGDLTLVLEHIAGRPLDVVLGEAHLAARPLPVASAVQVGLALAETVERVHHAGLALRDLKSPNVVVLPDGTLRLIDLELATPVGASCRTEGTLGGTNGYYAPGRPDIALAADDVFALGAILHHAVTGADPQQAPPGGPGARVPSVLRPQTPRWLDEVIMQCLAPDAAVRFPSAGPLADALRHGMGRDEQPSCCGGDEDEDFDLPTTIEELTISLSRARVDVERRSRPGPRGLAVGAGGVLAVLSQLSGLCRDAATGLSARHRAQALARELTAPSTLVHVPIGLHFGEAGAVLAVFEAGRRLDDESLVQAAATQARALARRIVGRDRPPPDPPDVATGLAGAVRALLRVGTATGASDLIDAALDGGHRLLRDVARSEGGATGWVVPEGGVMAGQCPLGYLHGVSGIADVLVDVWRTTAEPRWADVVSDVAGWLSRLGGPALEDGSGLVWPMVPGGGPAGVSLRYGATGIGEFLLRAHEAGLGEREPALAAGRTVAACAPATDPTQLYGLAGAGGFLLHLHRCTDDPAWLEAAQRTAGLVGAYLIRADGRTRVMVGGKHLDDDWGTGTAGVAALLAAVAAHRAAPALRSG